MILSKEAAAQFELRKHLSTQDLERKNIAFLRYPSKNQKYTPLEPEYMASICIEICSGLLENELSVTFFTMSDYLYPERFLSVRRLNGDTTMEYSDPKACGSSQVYYVYSFDNTK